MLNRPPSPLSAFQLGLEWGGWETGMRGEWEGGRSSQIWPQAPNNIIQKTRSTDKEIQYNIKLLANKERQQIYDKNPNWPSTTKQYSQL